MFSTNILYTKMPPIYIVIHYFMSCDFLSQVIVYKICKNYQKLFFLFSWQFSHFPTAVHLQTNFLLFNLYLNCNNVFGLMQLLNILFYIYAF